jgi:hypothetical protein
MTGCLDPLVKTKRWLHPSPRNPLLSTTVNLATELNPTLFPTAESWKYVMSITNEALNQDLA